jgi:hypothetical protein
LCARGFVFGQVAARLAHHPNRWCWQRLACKGAQDRFIFAHRVAFLA